MAGDPIESLNLKLFQMDWSFALRLNAFYVEVESDSPFVTGYGMMHWNIFVIWDELLVVKVSLSMKFSHVYQVVNSITDCPTKDGADGISKAYILFGGTFFHDMLDCAVSSGFNENAFITVNNFGLLLFHSEYSFACSFVLWFLLSLHYLPTEVKHVSYQGHSFILFML